MKSRTVYGLAVAAVLFVASSGVDAQMGGLIKRKAAEVVKPKPAPVVEEAPKEEKKPKEKPKKKEKAKKPAAEESKE